jgi:hypothetical protein
MSTKQCTDEKVPGAHPFPRSIKSHQCEIHIVRTFLLALHQGGDKELHVRVTPSDDVRYLKGHGEIEEVRGE